MSGPKAPAHNSAYSVLAPDQDNGVNLHNVMQMALSLLMKGLMCRARAARASLQERVVWPQDTCLNFILKDMSLCRMPSPQMTVWAAALYL